MLAGTIIFQKFIKSIFQARARIKVDLERISNNSAGEVTKEEPPRDHSQEEEKIKEKLRSLGYI